MPDIALAASAASSDVRFRTQVSDAVTSHNLHGKDVMPHTEVPSKKDIVVGPPGTVSPPDIMTC